MSTGVEDSPNAILSALLLMGVLLLFGGLIGSFVVLGLSTDSNLSWTATWLFRSLMISAVGILIALVGRIPMGP